MPSDREALLSTAHAVKWGPERDAAQAQLVVKDFDRLYAAAIKADEVFHAEVVRQFGDKRAGDMRYRSDLHDAATCAAAELKHEADRQLNAVWSHRSGL